MARPTLLQVTREVPLGLAIAFCLAIRAIFYSLYGLSFDPDVIWWQMLDTELLTAAPFQSIYLMHMQPPLLNLLYAAALALPGGTGFSLLHVLFVGSSLMIVALLYAFLRRFGARPYASALAAALFGVLPQTLLYENIYFYSHLEAVLVLGAAAFACAYFEQRRLVAFVGFAISLVVLALLRSLFHLAWVAVVLIGACILASRQRGWDRGALLVAIAAICAIATVYLKNLNQFGSFSVSSWDGISLMSMVLPTRAGDQAKFAQVVDDIKRRADGGELSPATVAALQTSDIWSGWVGFAKGCNSSEQRRVLCSVERSNGELNFNHTAVIDYSRSLAHDAWHLLRRYPRVYLDHLGSSLFTFLGTPSWDYRRLPLRLDVYINAWNKLMLYKSTLAFQGTGKAPAAWWESAMNRLASSSLPLVFLVIIGSIFIMVEGIVETIGYWRGSRATADWVFPMLVLALFASIPNLINGVEAQRIRYSVEPLIYLAVLTFGLRLMRRQRRTRLAQAQTWSG
jgi:hypothetical protein